ncbi:A/G-specific adenine glycosylase [Novimethylophilus kurashikiensis]|uniref:Adenine DNA glycosylase n=1 Tax=Novimethylophilus kurashikiensis TaxID=1825523 RepID=A0A2R5FAF6_9PROT|nr:A/G-specific adenine glycosylase [Novimethylophilus kurashikiensis]GBG13671.1 A/G-specific adenine glycosylase [Novimethylophilus kurashikiensis]
MQNFSQKLIDWQRQHGRHTLPWQNTRDPYAIWISEIMLQQTQVSAVIPYYQRFMTRFPTIAALAGAHEDEVLQHWSGLGYYSRARNLHEAARRMVTLHQGTFPQNFEDIQALPGIGRSTAAAIASFAFGQRQAILDGNVKRVFARVFGISGWPGQPAIEKQMWVLAESLLPTEDIERYTQGLMDLGATLCTRTKPDCLRCPMQDDCVALRESLTTELPSPKPRKALSEKETVMLVIMDGEDILLEKRPSSGIWGGLWSLPEAAIGEDYAAIIKSRFGLEAELGQTWAPLTHTFTHFRLEITPQPLCVIGRPASQPSGTLWLSLDDAIEAAIPTPVRTLLTRKL